MKNPTTIAFAHPNIALIKYWGKCNEKLNIPAVSSLSITLDTLLTRTEIGFDEHVSADVLTLNTAIIEQGPALQKVQTMADYFRALTGNTHYLNVSSDNNFPTAAGLASSASGFAALAVGMDHVFAASLSLEQLAVVARLGSGSAPRSLFEGFVQMDKGHQDDGLDAIAQPLYSRQHWPLEVVVAITSEASKSMSSTVGMNNTRATSPYYGNWIEHHDADMVLAAKAIEARDFARLAEVSEHSCLKMHAVMMSSNPGLLYWNAATMACLHEIRTMRATGVEVFFTVDAGPQVKAICSPGVGAAVAQRLQQIDGVSRTITTGLGVGAYVEKPK